MMGTCVGDRDVGLIGDERRRAPEQIAANGEIAAAGIERSYPHPLPGGRHCRGELGTRVTEVCLDEYLRIERAVKRGRHGEAKQHRRRADKRAGTEAGRNHQRHVPQTSSRERSCKRDRRGVFLLRRVGRPLHILPTSNPVPQRLEIVIGDLAVAGDTRPACFSRDVHVAAAAHVGSRAEDHAAGIGQLGLRHNADKCHRPAGFAVDNRADTDAGRSGIGRILTGGDPHLAIGRNPGFGAEDDLLVHRYVGGGIERHLSRGSPRDSNHTLGGRHPGGGADGQVAAGRERDIAANLHFRRHGGGGFRGEPAKRKHPAAPSADALLDRDIRLGQNGDSARSQPAHAGADPDAVANHDPRAGIDRDRAAAGR